MWINERVFLATAICASVVCSRPHVGGSFNSGSVDVSQACGQPPVDAKPQNGNFVKSCQNWSEAASTTLFQAKKWEVALDAGCFDKWIVTRKGSDDVWGVRLPFCVGNAGASQYNVMWVDSYGDPHGFFKDETTGNKLPNTWWNSNCECGDEPEDDIFPTIDPAEPTEEDPSTTFNPVGTPVTSSRTTTSFSTLVFSTATSSIATTSSPSSVTESSSIMITPVSESTSSITTTSFPSSIPIIMITPVSESTSSITTTSFPSSIPITKTSFMKTSSAPSSSSVAETSSIMITPVSDSTSSITTTSFPSSIPITETSSITTTSVPSSSFVTETSSSVTTPVSESTSSPTTSSSAGIVPTVTTDTPSSSNKSNTTNVAAPVAGAAAGAAVLVAAGAAIMKKLHSSSAAAAAAASHADLFGAGGAGTANPGYVPHVVEEINPLFNG